MYQVNIDINFALAYACDEKKCFHSADTLFQYDWDREFEH